MDFSGDSDLVSIDLGVGNCLFDPGFTGCEMMSLAVWIKILDLPSDLRGGIFTTRRNMITFGTQIYTTTHSIANYIIAAKGNTEYEIFNYYPDGWYHVVLTLDHNAGVMKMYQNGQYKEEDDNPYVTSHTYSLGTNTLVIGRESTEENDEYGNFQIDELNVFSHVLSTSNIQALYSQGI